MSNRVCIDVGGQEFTIARELLDSGRPSRLTEMLGSTSKPEQVHCRIAVDRPAEMFAAVLAMYQTGELHIPMTSCPGAFMNELLYWNISKEALSTCCFNRLRCFLDEEETLKQFRESLDVATEHEPSVTCSRLQKIRATMWNIVEYRRQSLPAKIFFMLSLVMVLLSIFVLAVKTDDNFRRSMTNCERLQYMISSGMEDVDLVRKTLEKYCDIQTLPGQQENNRLRTSNNQDDLFQYVYFEFDEINSDTETDQPTNLSIAYNFRLVPTGKFIKIPNMKVRIFSLFVLEMVTLVFFTVELISRLLSCPSFKTYFLSIVNITDVLALICTYIHFIILDIHKHEQFKDSWIDLLEYTQMLRAFRLFRIVSNLRAGQVLVYSLKNNVKDLSILVLFVVSGMCTYASCFYLAEDKKDVSSILSGWYWAVVTMTTVGYGDISPKTSFGRVVACLCAITGVLLFALTLPIFSNHFMFLYQHADTKLAFKESRKNTTVIEKCPNRKEQEVIYVDKTLDDTV